MNIVSGGLLLFWGIYFSMAATGNIADWLTKHGHRGRLFRSSSKNLELMERVAKRHGSGQPAIKALFAVIMSWELLSAAAYLAAFSLLLAGSAALLPYAFFIGMGLFAGLVLGNEAFVARAPAEVVAGQRAKLVELEAQRAAVAALLERC
jgi:hypothetical protein